MPKVLLCNPMLHRTGHEWLASRAEVELVPPDAPTGSLLQAIVHADAALVRPPYRMTKELIAAGPRLRVIGTEGTGFDQIDVVAATEAGIPVVNNVGLGANAVAEHTVGLMLALARRIVRGNDRFRREGWACRASFFGPEMGTELVEKTVGIVGFGQIGQRVASICRAAFGMRILAYSPSVENAVFESTGVECRRTLRDLLPEADFLTVHAPLNESTRHMIGIRELRLMKPSAYLINTARGAIVDQAALAAALRDRWIAGAGIDVFDPEPAEPSNSIFGLEHVIVTPHIGGLSDESARRLSLGAAEQIMQVLRDERPPRLVNPEVWENRRRP